MFLLLLLLLLIIIIIIILSNRGCAPEPATEPDSVDPWTRKRSPKSPQEHPRGPQEGRKSTKKEPNTAPTVSTLTASTNAKNPHKLWVGGMRKVPVGRGMSTSLIGGQVL